MMANRLGADTFFSQAPSPNGPGLAQANHRTAVVILVLWQPSITSSILRSPGNIPQVLPPHSLQTLVVFPSGRTRSCRSVPLLRACTARGRGPVGTGKETLPRTGLTPLDTNGILNITIRMWRLKRWLFFPLQITSFSSGLPEGGG